jgi:DNA repair protein RadC
METLDRLEGIMHVQEIARDEDSMTDCEILELLLASSSQGQDHPPTAKKLIEHFGSLHGILQATSQQLDDIPSVNLQVRTKLQGLRLALRRLRTSHSLTNGGRDQVSRLGDYWRSKLGSFHTEVFETAFLDSALHLLHNGIERTAEGTIGRATVYPRRILESALFRGAAGVVLAHNHPNGVVLPSEHDKLVTRAIVLAAESIDVKVVDHLIVSRTDTFSFRSAGLL